MITHRMSTRAPSEPSPQFYKIIALSFLGITIVLLGVVVFLTSQNAEVAIYAKEDNETIPLQVKLSMSGGVGAIKGSVSSTIFRWSQIYHPTGNKQVEGVAKGEVILFNTSVVPQALVKTTRLLSEGGVLFRLATAVTVPANGQISATVYANEPGVKGEIDPSAFTIPGLNTPKQKLIFAKSTQRMSGGLVTTGVLTQADLTQAQNDFKSKIVDAFLSSQPGAAGARDGQVVLAGDVALSVDHNVGDEVSAFTVFGNATIIVAAYNPDELASAINQQISQKIDARTERLLAVDKKPQLSISAYNLKTATADLLARQEVLVTLDAHVDKLAPTNFVGKKKDEIQRYVLGLQHVTRAVVTFSPSWMLSAPTAPDRIKVVVKNGQ